MKTRAKKVVKKKTTKPRLQSLTKAKVGQYYEATVAGIKTTGVLFYEKGNWYLCSNDVSGARCSFTFNFKYSWTVGNGSLPSLRANEVTSLKLLPKLHKGFIPVAMSFKDVRYHVMVYSSAVKIGCQIFDKEAVLRLHQRVKTRYVRRGDLLNDYYNVGRVHKDCFFVDGLRVYNSEIARVVKVWADHDKKTKIKK
jgi:hypothetical protein